MQTAELKHFRNERCQKKTTPQMLYTKYYTFRQKKPHHSFIKFHHAWVIFLCTLGNRVDMFKYILE